MDFALSSDLAALAAEARAVGAAAADRRTVREDGWLMGFDPAFALELAERGWLGMTWPAAVGGGGHTALERFVVFEALIGEGAPLAACYFADRQIGPTLLQYGTAEQQARWLPPILAGTDVWCIGMSEPDAGSDVASLRTRAVRDPDDPSGWIVDGAKVWTSGAAHARWCYLIARTDPTARPHAGLSELVVDLRSPGVEVRPIVDATGDGHFCEVRFEGVRVPGDHLIGEENGSFRQVMRQMEHERGGIDRLVSNHRLYRDVLAVADLSSPVLRQRAAELESAHRIGRLLVLREVLGQAPPQFSAVTKTFCTEHEQRVADFCVQALGMAATATEAPAAEAPATESPAAARQLDLAARVARGAVYAPAYTIMGGTTQILRTIIADRILALPR